jgi:NAD(P) transhydrogenase
VNDFDLLCIGSGPAGQRAAIQAAKLGKPVAVVERRRTVGGACVDTGTIPSKTFREAVISFATSASTLGTRDARHTARPSIDQLMQRVHEVVRRETMVVGNQLCRNNVSIIYGEASFVDPHTILVRSGGASQTLSADNILISSGTEPAQPPGVAADGETIITSDGVFCLKRLPKSMAVVGGGVIGIEYASIFAALGVDVTLVEKGLVRWSFSTGRSSMS